MSNSLIYRPTRAEINLDNLAFNFRSVKNFLGDEISYMAIVKADGYGHGAIRCARKLAAEGVEWFGVALPEEGLELRQYQIEQPILCLGGFWAGQENLLLENNLTPVIYQPEIAETLNRKALEKNVTVNIHIKIDTGMGRIGVRFDEAKHFADKIKVLKNLHVEGIMTHFAAADDLSENDFTDLQIRRFDEITAVFEEKGFRPRYKDLANSPGALAHQNARGNMVRLGGILYGLKDDVLPEQIEKPDVKPVMSLRTCITHLKRVPKGETLGYSRAFKTTRDSIIATIPIGYADGYRRALSNCGHAIVGGQIVSIVGRVSMDWTILDVTEVAAVKVDDEVILIGECGELKVSAEEMAKLAHTISYEITCGISQRVNRKYVEGEK